MFGLVARLLGGMIEPVVDKISDFGASLLRKLALFLVAGVSLVVVAIALTVAFDLWIASMAGAIAGALAVAGLYLTIAAAALFFALRGGKGRPASAAGGEPASAGDERAATERPLDEQVDRFTAPLLGILQSLGLRREQIAVLAGMSIAKQLKPLPMVGLAIVAGFLLGRMGGGLRGLASMDTIWSMVDLFTGKGDDGESGDEEVDKDERRAA